jgi:hypothetical protein
MITCSALMFIFLSYILNSDFFVGRFLLYVTYGRWNWVGT